MTILHRKNIVGKKIVNILQTEDDEVGDFSYRNIFVTVDDGTIFALISDDFEKSPPLVGHDEWGMAWIAAHRARQAAEQTAPA